MGIVKSTSKKPDGPCSFEGCKETIKQGTDYLWDFDNSKAYCKGGWSKPGMPLCRSPEEGMVAVVNFKDFIIKAIPEVLEKTYNIDPKKADEKGINYLIDTFKEIFLGKTQVVK
jgi:hypothetical protein